MNARARHEPLEDNRRDTHGSRSYVAAYVLPRSLLGVAGDRPSAPSQGSHRVVLPAWPSTTTTLPLTRHYRPLSLNSPAPFSRLNPYFSPSPSSHAFPVLDRPLSCFTSTLHPASSALLYHPCRCLQYLSSHAHHQHIDARFIVFSLRFSFRLSSPRVVNTPHQMLPPKQLKHLFPDHRPHHVSPIPSSTHDVAALLIFGLCSFIHAAPS